MLKDLVNNYFNIISKSTNGNSKEINPFDKKISFIFLSFMVRSFLNKIMNVLNQCKTIYF